MVKSHPTEQNISSQHTASRHVSSRGQPLAVLQHNSDAGCRPCSVIVQALRSFHGDWIFTQEKLEFSDFGIYGTTQTINLNLYKCKGVPKDYEQYAGRPWSGPRMELVSEPAKPNVDLFACASLALAGSYAGLGLKAGRQLPLHPAQNVSLMREWIQDCLCSHPRCRSNKEPALPTRVVKLGTLDEPVIRLEETSGRCGCYAALSHRWGIDVLLTTTRDTLTSHKNAIDWSTLSKIFQDAITLARLLGLDYLWIDSLCIVQDDRADWQVESSRMASIYENAHVVIAANTTSEGFLEAGALRPTKSMRMQIDGDDKAPLDLLLRTPRQHSNFYASALEGGMEVEEDYPLWRRAWCFQERLLATRILQFTDSEVVFECKTGQHCECGTINHVSSTPIKYFFDAMLQEEFRPVGVADNAWDAWTMILRPYVTKDITYTADILPALAGLASCMQSNFDRYISGLWENELASGLFWFADVGELLQNPTETGPTFSWTSVASRFHVKELTWPYRSADSDSEQLLTTNDVDCIIDGLNEYGTVSSASMKVQGPIMKVTLTAGGVSRPHNAILKSGEREQAVRFWTDGLSLTALSAEADLFCLLGFIWTQDFDKRARLASALVLRRLEPESVYERVGCIPHLNNDESWLGLTSIVELTIV